MGSHDKGVGDGEGVQFVGTGCFGLGRSACVLPFTQ